jgi:Glycosyl transferase family 11
MHAVRLKGGLGNQLFQWALACALAERGHRVVIDPRLVLQGPRRFELAELCRRYRVSVAPSRGLTLAGRLGLSRTATGYRLVREPQFRYWPGIESLAGRSLLDGYWQSPRYFTRVSSPVRASVHSFAKAMLSAAGRELHDQIGRERASVSIHVRRGDYVTKPSASELLGFVGETYLARAVGEMRSRGATRFYVFSDDLDWVKGHFVADDMHIVTRTMSVAAAGELALMTACQGHIVANSSFSWWGAWLNRHPTLGVIAPKPWFRHGTEPVDDLLPPDWAQVERDAHADV